MRLWLTDKNQAKIYLILYTLEFYEVVTLALVWKLSILYLKRNTEIELRIIMMTSNQGRQWGGGATDPKTGSLKV